jgi:hypothetical protein
MNGLFPIIRRKRRPLLQENTETLKAEIPKSEPVQPAAIVPLVESVPESVPDVPPVNRAKTRHAQRPASNETP